MDKLKILFLYLLSLYLVFGGAVPLIAAANGDLTVDGTISGAGAWVVKGNVDVNTTATVSTTGDYELRGNFDASDKDADVTITSGGTVTLSGEGAQVLTTTATRKLIVNNLIIDDISAGGTAVSLAAAAGDLDVTGTLSINAKEGGADNTFDINDNVVTISGNATLAAIGASVDFTDVGCQVAYDGASAQTIIGTTYDDLDLSGAGAKSLDGNVIVSNDFAHAGGALTIDQDFTLEGTGDFATVTNVASGKTLSLDNTNAHTITTLTDNNGTIINTGAGAEITTIATVSDNNGNITGGTNPLAFTNGFTHSAGTITAGSGDITFGGNMVIGDGANADDAIVAGAANDLTFAGDLTITATDGKITSTGNVEVQGDFVNSRSTSTDGINMTAGTFTMNKATAQNVGGGGFYDMVLDGGGAKTFTADVSISNSLDANDDVVVSDGITLSLGDGSADFDDNLTFNNADITGEGLDGPPTLDLGNSSVTFSSADAQTITFTDDDGVLDLYNLTFTGGGDKTFHSATDFTGTVQVTNQLTINGDDMDIMFNSGSNNGTLYVSNAVFGAVAYTTGDNTEIEGKMKRAIGTDGDYLLNNVNTILTTSGDETITDFTLDVSPNTNPANYNASYSVNRKIMASYTGWTAGTIGLQVGYADDAWTPTDGDEYSGLENREQKLQFFNNQVTASTDRIGTTTTTTPASDYLSANFDNTDFTSGNQLIIDSRYCLFITDGDGADWATGGNWDVGEVPGQYDEVEIRHDITIADAGGSTALTVDKLTVRDNTLTIGSGTGTNSANLTVTTTTDVGNASSTAASEISVADGSSFTATGNVNISDVSTNEPTITTAADGAHGGATFTATADFTCDGGTITNNGTIEFGGVFTPDDIATITGTTVYNSSSAQALPAGMTYTDLNLDQASEKTFPATVTVLGEYTKTNSATSNYTSNTTDFTYGSAGAQDILADTYYELTLSGAGAKTIQDGSTVAVTTDLTHTGGAITIDDDLSITGAASFTEITDIASGKTLDLGSTGTITTLTANTGTILVGSGLLTITDLNANAGTISALPGDGGGDGAITMTNQADFAGTITGGAGLITFSDVLNMSGGSAVLTSGAGGIQFDGAVTTEASDLITSATAEGDLDFNATVNNSGSITLTHADADATFAADFTTNYGTITTTNGGLVTYESGVTTIPEGAYNNLTLAKSDGTMSGHGAIFVSGTLNIADVLDMGANTLTFDDPAAGIDNGVDQTHYINGAVKRDHQFEAATNYEFNSVNTTMALWAQSGATYDATITVDDNANPSAGNGLPDASLYVKRKFSLAQSNWVDEAIQNLKLGYIASELQGGLTYDKAIIYGLDGSSDWLKVNGTTASTTGENWVSLTGVKTREAAPSNLPSNTYTEFGMFPNIWGTLGDGELTDAANWDDPNTPDENSNIVIYHDMTFDGSTAFTCGNLTLSNDGSNDGSITMESVTGTDEKITCASVTLEGGDSFNNFITITNSASGVDFLVNNSNTSGTGMLLDHNSLETEAVVTVNENAALQAFAITNDGQIANAGSITVGYP